MVGKVRCQLKSLEVSEGTLEKTRFAWSCICTRKPLAAQCVCADWEQERQVKKPTCIVFWLQTGAQTPSH
eukprot:m.146929 g.146929  ORF g.146929 m.146929 type:complete len:70 (+) comp24331_c0_seq2:1565-1774(+)